MTHKWKKGPFLFADKTFQPYLNIFCSFFLLFYFTHIWFCHIFFFSLGFFRKFVFVFFFIFSFWFRIFLIFFLFHILVLILDFSDISFLYSFLVQGFSGISFSGPYFFFFFFSFFPVMILFSFSRFFSVNFLLLFVFSVHFIFKNCTWK